MTKAQKIDKEIAALNKKINELRKKRKEVFRAYFDCGSCRKRTLISNCDLIRFYTIHDNVYTDCECVVEEGVLCPKCNIVNRCLSDRSQDRYIVPYVSHENEYFRDVKQERIGWPFQKRKTINI